MTLTPPVLSRLALWLTALAMLATPLLLRGWPVLTQLLVASSLLMAGLCLSSAAHVLGARPALWLALIALPVGWFAKQMGASDGWFFGSYDYTDVLGPRFMVKHDGWWFGETLQGFVGWMLVAFAIVFAFRLALRRTAAVAPAARLRDVLVPLGLYGALMVYEATQGVPVETRTIAVFVMGIPLFCAACGLFRWHREAA